MSIKGSRFAKLPSYLRGLKGEPGRAFLDGNDVWILNECGVGLSLCWSSFCTLHYCFSILYRRSAQPGIFLCMLLTALNVADLRDSNERRSSY